MMVGCSDDSDEASSHQNSTPAASTSADLVLLNAQVYTFAWSEPSLDGEIAEDAPIVDGQWRPDATAIGIQDGTIIYVGDDITAKTHVDDNTQIVDLAGATRCYLVLPTLIPICSILVRP